MLQKSICSLVLVLVCGRAAISVPVIQNANFSTGLTSWSVLGTVTGSTNGFFGASPYAVLQSGGGANLSTVELALGLMAGGLNASLGGVFTSYTVVYQDITGSYNAGDSIDFDIGGLSNTAGAGGAVPAVGVVDLNTGTVANLIGGAGVQLQFLGPPNGSGTDGFGESFGPLSSSSGPQSLLIGTSNPARFFALVTNSSGPETSALAFTAVSAVPGAPELALNQWLSPLVFIGTLGLCLRRRTQVR